MSTFLNRFHQGFDGPAYDYILEEDQVPDLYATD